MLMRLPLAGAALAVNTRDAAVNHRESFLR
jgi:hypothetical protein